MRLNKKNKKIVNLIILVASLALILTSIIPFISFIFQ